MDFVKLLSLLTGLYALHMLLKKRPSQLQEAPANVLYDHDDLLCNLDR